MIYDIVIIGSGPAGLTAAIYAARDNFKTLVIGGSKWGGQLMLTSTVDNFPGFPEGIMGPDLMEAMKKQAERFGSQVLLQNAAKVDFMGKPFRVWTDESFDQQGTMSNEAEAKSVIIATGAETVWLGLPNEQQLIGRGISSCAPCDAFFFRGKKVIVVGGGDSAMEEALTLAKFAAEVTIVHRRDTFKASKIMQERVLSLPNVKTCMNSAVINILGENKVEGVKLKDTISNEERNMAIDGIFVAIGHSPTTKIFEGQINLDEKGYVQKMSSAQLAAVGNPVIGNYQMATSVPGVFVAGDVHDYHFKQAVTAAGFGCMAFFDAKRYLENPQ